MLLKSLFTEIFSHCTQIVVCCVHFLTSFSVVVAALRKPIISSNYIDVEIS